MAKQPRWQHGPWSLCPKVRNATFKLTLALASALALTSASLAFGQAALEAKNAAPVRPGLYVKVSLNTPVKLSKLKPGDVIEGTLARDVYSGDRKLFPAGSSVRLTVDHLEKHTRARNDHWPWVVNAFTPRHEMYPAFQTADVVQDTGSTPLHVSLISSGRLRDVHATAKKSKSAGPAENQGAVATTPNAKRPATPTLVLEASDIEPAPAAEAPGSNPWSEIHDTLPPGTRCKVLLLADVSASKSKVGDVVEARLLEPVLLNDKVALPAGSLFTGRVVKRTPPRWGSRSGSLYLTFSELTVPAGQASPIAASLAGAELNAGSHTRMDAEGRLHGEHPGKAWMAINLGVSSGIAKEVDDGVQLVIEALVSTATDASTAGTARIVSSCASGLYMATRRGRDVVLPRFTEMDISLDRPLSLNPDTAPPPALGK